MPKTIHFNELALTELVLLIDVSSIAGKLHLDSKRDVKQRIMKMAMLLLIGRYRRIFMNLCLLLH
jgi:hypothetical protein